MRSILLHGRKPPLRGGGAHHQGHTVCRVIRNLLIRVAVLDDSDDIAVVHVEAWRAAYRGLMPQHVLDGLSVSRRADGWREILQAQDGQTLVATDSDEALLGGFVNVGVSRDEDAAARVGEMRSLYLRDQWWNTGAGGQMHDAGLAHLRGRFDEATLWVLDTNRRGREFYTRRGWKPDGAVKTEDLGGVTLSDIRYRRPL